MLFIMGTLFFVIGMIKLYQNVVILNITRNDNAQRVENQLLVRY